ncbi:hypothetical protein PFLUV_G00070720 [Perca fluviatilis]|uniref:Uncharacterized protein n=1 Tax=Perca fluviatilis TaxID=8168 RepID=A0A6A5FE36_PERFL|nr:hypothetical protein PFLUV_G00070720 [Perca fluviatilis]
MGISQITNERPLHASLFLLWEKYLTWQEFTSLRLGLRCGSEETGRAGESEGGDLWWMTAEQAQRGQSLCGPGHSSLP